MTPTETPTPLPPPTIEPDKDVSPASGVGTVDVSYLVTIRNNSTTDTVNLTSFSDDMRNVPAPLNFVATRFTAPALAPGVGGNLTPPLDNLFTWTGSLAIPPGQTAQIIIEGTFSFFPAQPAGTQERYCNTNVEATVSVAPGTIDVPQACFTLRQP